MLPEQRQAKKYSPGRNSKMKYLWIALLWAGYCALHSFLISTGFTNRMIRMFKNYYAFYRLFYVAISIILFVPLVRLSAHLNDQVIVTYNFPLSIIRHVLQSGSLLMFFWAFFFDYDSLSFFGIRQIADFGKIKKIDPAQEIKKSGLLGIIRHPMYFALIIYLWCQTFRVGDVVVNTVLTIYILIGTRLEEKKLVLEFGDVYVNYQHEVPMLLPFTKPGFADLRFSRR
jgi:methanethiol S-methyltransferase